MVAFSLASIVVAASGVLAAPSIKPQDVIFRRPKYPSHLAKRPSSSPPLLRLTLRLPLASKTTLVPTLGHIRTFSFFRTQFLVLTGIPKHRSAGAVAELFDISCLVGTSTFNRIQDDVFTVWKLLPKQLTAAKVVELLHFAKTPTILGQHYFIINPLTGVGISPKWDFTSQGATKETPTRLLLVRVLEALQHLPALKTSTGFPFRTHKGN